MRPKDAADLPPPIEQRQHRARGDLGRGQPAGARQDAGDACETVDSFHVGADGLARVTDPNGMSLAFRVSKRTPITVEADAAERAGLA